METRYEAFRRHLQSNPRRLPARVWLSTAICALIQRKLELVAPDRGATWGKTSA
jgi:hypothetical protein